MLLTVTVSIVDCQHSTVTVERSERRDISDRPALIAWARALRAEFGGHNIHVRTAWVGRACLELYCECWGRIYDMVGVREAV